MLWTTSVDKMLKVWQSQNFCGRFIQSKSPCKGAHTMTKVSAPISLHQDPCDTCRWSWTHVWSWTNIASHLTSRSRNMCWSSGNSPAIYFQQESSCSRKRVQLGIDTIAYECLKTLPFSTEPSPHHLLTVTSRAPEPVPEKHPGTTLSWHPMTQEPAILSD